jgi:CRP-like cAMP-binding protein
LSFLAECGFHTVLEVARSVRLETYYRDQRVFLEGEPGEKLFIVITGQVAAWKRVPPPKVCYLIVCD